jgi:hypothetical protein
MQRRLAILGLLVLAGGAWSQVPSNGVHQEKENQKQQQNTQPVQLTPPPIPHAVDNAGNRTEGPSNRPSDYPWRELYAPANVPNWFLVIIAGVTGLFVYKTLRAIKKQADIMEKQATEAQVSGVEATGIALATAQAAQKSADAANAQIQFMKDKERARLVIRRLDIPEIYPPESILEGRRPLKVRVSVENLGASRAFNVRAYGMFNILSNPNGGPHEVGFLQDFPPIVDYGKDVHPLSLGGFGREFEDFASTGDFISITDEMAQQLRNGKIFIQASGLLVYEDVFGDTIEYPFRFVWRSIGDDDGGKWLTRSRWLDFSHFEGHSASDSKAQESKEKETN